MNEVNDVPSPENSSGDAAPHCMRCHGEMVEGWVMDAAHGDIVQQLWAPGQRVTTMFGTKLPPSIEIKPVITLRCIRCGYLESYAR